MVFQNTRNQYALSGAASPFLALSAERTLQSPFLDCARMLVALHPRLAGVAMKRTKKSARFPEHANHTDGVLVLRSVPPRLRGLGQDQQNMRG